MNFKLTRRNVYKRDQGCCRLCGGRLLLNGSAAVYIISVADGGKHEAENIVTAHPNCAEQALIGYYGPLKVLSIADAKVSGYIQAKGW